MVRPCQPCHVLFEWHKVILCDISRSGVRFLHSEQILPTEQMLLVMPDFKRRYVEIVRCRRLGDRYFEIGARFVKCLRPLPSSEKPAGSDAPGDTEPAGDLIHGPGKLGDAVR